LAGAAAILGFWPVTATPEDLARLDAAPPEAFAGRMGAVRQVLRLLIEHRLTTPFVQLIVIEAAEDAGQHRVVGVGAGSREKGGRKV
jgi:hypothetical protein